MNIGFNTLKMSGSIHVDNSRNVKKFINSFKYKCEALSYVRFNIY